MEITENYALDPQDALFRVRGTRGHGVLDLYVDASELAEERLTDSHSSGMFDFYDPATRTLYDDKFCGSYKIGRALGLYQVEVETGGVYKTGAKKGHPKTRKEWREGGHRDRFDWAVQLNDYRRKLETLGFPVEHLVVEAICRDGNTFMATSRGVEQNGTLIPLNRISDHWISAYMGTKSQRLLQALNTGMLPPTCKNRESWSGRKCQKYCNVREQCKEGVV